MSESRIPSLDDFEDAEHCVLEDVTVQQPALTVDGDAANRLAREIQYEIVVKDRFRGRQTCVRLYAEGWADIEVERRRQRQTHHRIDLRYLDPAPVMERYHPVRLIRAAGILTGLTVLCAIPVGFGWLMAYFLPALLVGLTATLGALLVAIYMSHEKITFQTLHGRADTIRFRAGLGTIGRFHKLLPKLVNAIGDAAETIDDETAVYLRAEMREHYRLRGTGVLTDEQCAASTEKILGEFDGPL